MRSIPFLISHFSFLIPEDAPSCKSALYGTVGIVPVVQQTQREGGALLAWFDGLSRLLLAQQVVGTIEQTDVAAMSLQQQPAIGFVLNGETVVTLLPVHGAAVGFHRDGSSVPVLVQFLHSQLNGRRRCHCATAVVPQRQLYLGRLWVRLIPQPQLVSVLRTGRQCQARNE